MAAYNILLDAPNDPIEEEWVWLTDLQTSFNGSEDPAPLKTYPRRKFTGSVDFNTAKEVRRYIATMFASLPTVTYFPLYQYAVKLKQSVSSGASSVTVNALRSDFRAAKYALIVEGDIYEALIVDSVTSTTLSFTSNLANDFTARAVVMPLTQVYSEGDASITRRNPDESATASFKLSEYEPWTPFVSALNTETLTTFDSLPVLDINQMGTGFDQALDTGIIVDEYVGLSSVLSPWEQSKWTFPMRFLCNRIFDLSSWHWWAVFADYCKGSRYPFLVPSFRADFEVASPASATDTTVLVGSHEYQDHYWGLDTFSRIVIESDAGRHFAKVTGVTSVSGDDQLTFSPAIPSGAGWDQNQKIGFLLKARIADDRIVCEHYGARTEIALSIRTVA